MTPAEGAWRSVDDIGRLDPVTGFISETSQREESGSYRLAFDPLPCAAHHL
jgi:hypothetical protein